MGKRGISTARTFKAAATAQRIRKMTHTPGPWKANIDRDYAPDNEEGELVSVDVIKLEVMPEGYPVIAELIKSPFEDDEVVANARLIAAVPDLVAACNLLIKSFIDYSEEDWVDNAPLFDEPCVWDAYEKAKQALAKCREGLDEAV